MAVIASATSGDVAMAAVWVVALCVLIIAIAWGSVRWSAIEKGSYLSRRGAKVALRKAELDAQARIAEAEARRYEAATRLVGEP